MHMIIKTERELGDGVATRVWKVEPGVMLTSMEIHRNGEKIETVQPTVVGFFYSEEKVVEFVTDQGAEIVSQEEVED